MTHETASSNGREFSRSRVCVRSEVRLASGILLEGEVHDVSMNGIWFATERMLPVGNEVRVSLHLKGGTEHRIDTRGRVARVDEDGMAISFITIDADSLEHLRNLVIYNAEDTEKVDEEFQSHLGLKRQDF